MVFVYTYLCVLFFLKYRYLISYLYEYVRAKHLRVFSMWSSNRLRNSFPAQAKWTSRVEGCGEPRRKDSVERHHFRPEKNPRRQRRHNEQLLKKRGEQDRAKGSPLSHTHDTRKREIDRCPSRFKKGKKKGKKKRFFSIKIGLFSISPILPIPHWESRAFFCPLCHLSCERTARHIRNTIILYIMIVTTIFCVQTIV